MNADLASIVRELKERDSWVKSIREGMFREQLALHDDKALLKACHSGRRAGKSEGMPRSTVLDVLQAGPGDTVILGAETLKKCKALHWEKVRELVLKYKLPLVPNGQDAAWYTPWKSRLVFWGINDDGAVELLRGFRIAAARFDEVASYATKLQKMVYDVLIPALGDLGGQLTLYGTPTVTCAGAWHSICVGADSKNFSVHHWDARQNPFFRPDKGGAAAWFEEMLKANGWTWDNATFQRELLGLFVNDDDSRVYRYVSGYNEASLPESYNRDTWSHTLGVDFGYEDDCSWVVLASHPHEKQIYVVDSHKQNHLIIDEAAEITAKYCAKYHPSRVVGDAGGLGKDHQVYWNARFAGRELVPGHTLLPMLKADKQGKRSHIDLLNTEFRTGRLKLVRGTCEGLATELLSLPWKDSNRIHEHPSYDNHLCDALLYAFGQHFSYLNSLPVKTPVKSNRPDDEEQVAREEARYRSRQSRDWYDDGGCAD